MSTGKVWLVGAGPGDAGLLTLKGRDALVKADVVVYDALVGDAILAMIPDTAEAIDAGKRSGDHTLHQWQTNELLLEQAQAGKRVVRLKGGDPFLFGRGGEELELLRRHGVPYEVVPGVTSPIAVPAYNGIPVTHRDFTSSLHIVTGHRRAGKDYDIDFAALVNTRGTLVFLMGLAAMEDILAGLLGAGMDPDMPAAVLSRGATAGQRRVVATVSTLAERARAAALPAPAIIVVGKVCALAEEFAWAEALPLFGFKVLVTRPRELCSTLSEKLRALGAEVVELPAVATVPVEDNRRLYAAIDRIREYQWLVLTSPSGVRIFFDELRARGQDVRALASVKIGALGEGTRAALRERGLLADVVPEKFDGDSLGMALAAAAKPGDRFLMPRARIGNREIVERLSDFQVDDVPLYDTVYLKNGAVDVKGMFERGVDCALFTSSSGVKAFAQAYPEVDPAAVLAACIGEKTEATARSLGMRTRVSRRATIDSLIELAVEICGEKRQTGWE